MLPEFPSFSRKTILLQEFHSYYNSVCFLLPRIYFLLHTFPFLPAVGFSFVLECQRNDILSKGMTFLLKDLHSC